MTGAGGVDALRNEFAGELRRRLDELAAALDGHDADLVVGLAHRLKGSALTLAMPDLVEAVERLEQAYRGRPADVVAGRAALDDARAAVGAISIPSDDVARLAHALRTPLNVVLGFAHLLQEGDLRPEDRRHADAIVQAAEQIAALIDEVAGVPRAAAPNTASPGTVAAPVTVLYVEDDPASARLAEELIGRMPAVRLLAAATGSEGIRLAEEEAPDLVLVDPGLPDLAGAEAVRRLWDAVDRAPVVVVTGESRPERLQELLDSGAAECLVKPLDAERLLALVDAARPV